MKLENFRAVAELIKERDYLLVLKKSMKTGGGIRLGWTDVRPDICVKMRPELILIIDQQIAMVGEKLAAFGVSTGAAA